MSNENYNSRYFYLVRDYEIFILFFLRVLLFILLRSFYIEKDISETDQMLQINQLII